MNAILKAYFLFELIFVSEALNRCKIAKLIDSKKRKVNINSFTGFLVYGLKYVFPTEPGAIVKGTPTAHSASPIKEHISSDTDVYVWSNAKGTHRGQAIEPYIQNPSSNSSGG